MRSCKDCIHSEPYFRGLLCHWVERNSDKLNLPAYLSIQGETRYSYCGLECCYPRQIDEKDYGAICQVFESKELDEEVRATLDNGDIIILKKSEVVNYQKEHKTVIFKKLEPVEKN
jgi:hypothetical protein